MAVGLGVLLLGGSSSPASTSSASARCGRCWRPAPLTTWQWQLQGTVDLSVPARVYDVDGLSSPAALVRRLHSRGRRVICYVDVGTWENWRADRRSFPPSLLGNGNGWPGERWLDIRQLDRLAPLMRARLSICRRKGFDAVEPDNLDGYANETGFPLTSEDQLKYNRRIARIAHELGLSIALKNDLDQVDELRSEFDFAINEECFQYRECGKLRPFTKHGKAVLEVEYSLPRAAFCPEARRLRFSAMRKRLSLDSYRAPC